MSIAATLQGIFGRVLRIEPRDLELDTPFLELGADSLALVEALRGIQQAYGIKLTIRQLFEQLPSISVLAGFLEANGAAPPQNVDPVVTGETLITPALFSQPPPRPPGEEGVVSPKGIPGGSAVERIFSMQIQAFNQLVAQQLQALGARGVAVRSPVLASVPITQAPPYVPAPAAVPVASSGDGAKGFWDRQGKPAIAPVVSTAPVVAPATTVTTVEALPDTGRGVMFSLYFFGHYPAEFRAGKYDLLFEAARYADRHGFSALWFPERHFHPFGGLSPNPSVLAAALARETERIALRAGSVVLPLHHPLRVAEEWSLVDNLSGGRVGLSYASGWHPNDFALAPEVYGRHRDLMFERIEEVRRLWRGEALRVRDGAGMEVDVRIYPRPPRRGLAEWITIVNNPDTWRRAGEMGVGVLTNLMGQTVEGLTGMVRIYREALAAAGHPPEKGHVTLLLHTFLDADPAVAVERARRPFYDYLKSSVGLLQNMMASEGITADFDRIAEEDLEYMLEMAFQRYVSTSALIGSPESCAPIVERLRAIGVDEIACLIDFGVEPTLVMAGLPVLAELKNRFGFSETEAELVPEPISVEPISVPLTEAQSDLYTVALVGKEALGAYYESGVLELRGPLDLGLLRRALQGEVDRHEALRTIFPDFLRAEETQAILPALRLEIPLLDAAGLPSERQEEIAGDWLEELAREPFDLAGPLVRASVLRLGERQSPRHLLSFAVHHLVADGLSIGIVLSEVFAAYEAMRAGCRPALPRPMQFREYKAWLAEAWTAERLAGDEAYWLDELAGELPVFEPPTDRPRPPVFTFRGHRQQIVLAAAARERILRFGRRHGATLYMTLLAVWAALLHRWTGQDDLITGSAQARRPLEGGDRLVGHCTDIMPLRSRLQTEGGGEPSFLRHLAAVRGRVLGAHDHGELSFSRLVRRLAVRRDPSRSPLVNVIFNLDPEWAIGPAGGLEIAERSPAIPFVKFDLAAHSVSAGERLVIYFDSRRDLFDAVTIERLAGRLVALLEGAMEFPERPLDELPWMTAADRAQLVAEALVPYPRERTVHELFAEVAAERPDAVAVEAGDRRLTYGELDALADAWAHRLRALGVGTDARVATVLERSPELIAAWLAAFKAGGAYVPLDPAFPEERLARLLTGSGAVAVLTVEEHREMLERISHVPVFALPLCCDEGLGWGSSEAKALPDSLAYVTYTSGSTGEPKGVAIPHRAVVRLVRETDYARLGPDDHVAHLAHVAFDATTFEIWGPLLNGGRVVVLDRDTAVSPHRLAAALRERGVTVLFLTTAFFNQMAVEEPAAFAGLRCVLTGGEAADPARFRAVLAAAAPDRLANIYGPAECTTFALWEPVEDLLEGAASVPIGRPIANTRICILSGWEPVAPGVAGELCLGGDGLARGYLGRPDLTAERFVPDPLATTPGERLYRTGDRARMRLDGRVEHLGRLDRQVKIRGFRIEPGEVEAVVAAHPGVREAVVVAGEDRLGEKRLVAWFVPGAGSPPTDRDLRGFLAARLPGSMIPAVFIAVPSLPLTASGKVDRRALAALAPEPAMAAQPVKNPTPAGPTTTTTDVLRGLWAEVLGREQVGPDDDFFELGGHSLLATRVLLRVRSLLGPDLPMHVLLDLPTPALFAARIDRELGGGAGSVPESRPSSGAIPVERRAPPSFAQERLWFFSRLAPGSIAYNLPAAFHLTGPLIPEALAAALGEIVRRHEALRTVFAEGEEGEPEQVVRAFTGFALPRVDLSALPDPGAAAESLIREEAQRPFDLGTGPLLRAFLLRLDGETHTLLLAAHHILADGWSFGVLGQELAALYRAALANESSPLPPLPQLPIQYADFAVWQRSWLQGEVLESLLEGWRRRLAGHPGVIELPTDRPRPPIQSFRGAIERLPFDSPGAAGELRDRLRRLGLRYKATPFMVALAALQVVLLHHTGEEDLLVGTPIAGRNRENIERLIGFFVNTLPLRTDLEGDPTFTGLVARVREVTLEAYAHQDLPFDKLVEAFAPARDLSRNPLVQVAFAFQNTLLPDRHLAPGLACDVEYVDAGTAKFDLTFFLAEDGLSGGVEYATDLFDAATVRRLQGHFLNVVRAAASAPDTAISELPILTPEERWQAVEAWNDTASEYPREIPVHRLFERVAARDPQAPAILWEGGTLSYGELDRWANRLAWRLRARGVGPEVAVALDMERSPELVVALLAVLKAGGFYVPLDAADPAERRALILEDSGAAVRLGRDDVAAAEAGDAGEDSGPSVAVDAEGLAYVIYTSGSTGRPKGVAVFHRAIARLVLNTDYVRLGPGERMAQVCNTAFDVAAFEVWGALLTGATLVVIPREVVLSPKALGEAYRRWGITVSFLTPPLFNEVMREAPETLAGVRQLLVGGEAVAPRWMREARAAAPQQRLLNAYGPTEATVFAAWHLVGTVPEGAPSVPIGLPIANTRLYVVDRHLRPVAVGVPGELCIAGDGLARGYLRRPGLTAERFVPDPFDRAGGRMYRTGDVARRLADGTIDYLGRTDAQVKVRGFRIELGEIEAALSRAPGVRECAVVVREQPEGERLLVAWVALEEGAAADLRGFLRERLPDFMVPAVFAPLDGFPRTPSGKVDRRALARLEPSGGSGSAPGFEAPRTPVEQIVADIWSEVLGLQRVSVRDSFFDLGGHSLLAGRVLRRLRTPLGVDLSLSQFFQHPTVAGLARLAGEARQTQRAGLLPLVRVAGAGPVRLSFAQERLWLVDQLQPGSTAYNMALPLVLTGRLDVPALGRALEEIARRHEVLRTRFAAGDGGPVQVVEPVSWLGLNPLSRVDLSGLPPEIARAELSRLADLHQPFDLARGPLFRAVLARVSAGEHALLAEMHHSVCDGWSLDVMTRELSALYGAFAAGRPSPLPEPPIQYSDFARWQRQGLQGEVVEAELAWWRGRLGENPPPLALATDRPRPAVPPAGGFRNESRVLTLPPELAGGLVALARGRRATLFVVLLAGFQALLHRHTHQPRVTVGSPVAGRTRLEVEELIGLFVNTLVLAADFSGEPTAGVFLDQVRDATLGAFDHQDLPFEQLVAALARDRDPSRQPLFQVMFVLQNNAQSEIDLPGLNLAFLPGGGSTTALFDLTLSAMEVKGEVACGINYAAELFDPTTIVRLLEQYRRLLEAVVDNAAQPVDRLPLLCAAERHQLAVEWPLAAGWPALLHEGELIPAGVWGEPGRFRADGRFERRLETMTETPETAKESLAEARRAELDRRRSTVASRRGQLSGDRRALLSKWVGGAAPVPTRREEAPPGPAGSADVTPLVNLHTSGTRPPIFLVHAAGGLVHDFVNLAQWLDPDQPFYALQSPALAGGEHFASVPEMAARYLEAVRSVQPRGPYRLGGYCIGGSVAFEMARQLRAMGEETGSLLLFDSPGPFSEPPPPLDEAELLSSFVRSYGNAAEVSADELRALPPEAWIDHVLDRVRATGGLGPSFDAAQLHRRWEVMKRNTRAILPYVPAGRLPLGAILFRAVDQAEPYRSQPFLGWERWLEGPIEVVDVKGGHLDVFLEPAVEAIGRELRDRTAVVSAV
jgi:natural product biosynthesis luciferase-like monooxygenase protein/amino acid adenylation domain-containing protein